MKNGQIVQGVETIEITDKVMEKYLGKPDMIYRDAPKLFPLTNKRLGATAANAGISKMSPPRIAMLHGLKASAVTLNHGERNIINNGIHHMLSESSFNVIIGVDSIFLSLVIKENNFGIKHYTLFLKDMQDTVYRLEVPAYQIFERKFGFALKPTKLLESLVDMNAGTVLKKGDILATSPSYDDGSYRAYANGNVGFITDPIVDQDAIIISDRLANKLVTDRYMEYEFLVSKDEIPINAHGDRYNYKSLLEPGDPVPDSNILFAKRSEKFITHKQLMTITQSDIVYTAHNSGGVVVDLEVIKPTSRVTPMQWTDQLDKWCHKGFEYSSEYAKKVEAIEKKGHKKWRGAVIVDYSKHAVIKNNRYKLFKKREPVNHYYIRMVVRHTVTARPTTKITTPDGGKGEITQVLPLEQMPKESTGEYADIIIHPKSTMNRMIMTRPHFATIGSAVYRLGKEIKNDIINTCPISGLHKHPKLIDKLFAKITLLQKLIGNGFHETYLNASPADKLDILKEVYGKSINSDNQLTVNIDVANPLRSETIIQNLREAKLLPEKVEMTQTDADGNTIKFLSRMRLGRIAVFPVNKWGDDGIAASISVRTTTGRPSRLNSNNKHMVPSNISSLRMFAETDMQIVHGAIGTPGLAEFYDRTGNPDSTVAVCRKIFNTDGPIDKAIDRDEIPFGRTIVNLAEAHIYNLSGYGLAYHSTSVDDIIKEYNQNLATKRLEYMESIYAENRSKDIT